MSLRNNRARRRSSVLGLSALALVAVPIAAYAGTTGSITGIVKSADGTPLKGVNVTLEGTGLTDVTDGSGRYTFEGLTPGTYTVDTDIVTFQKSSAAATVTADVNTPINFSLEKATLNTGTSKITGSTIRTQETNTQYSVTNRTEVQTKSQPNNLYQFPGLTFGVPGVTPDPSGYTHLRGSDFNQVGFAVDGINITSPLQNEFATNIVTVGLKSANIITGGADASFGGSTGGFINELTENGKDLKGGVIEGTFGPGYGWKYSGTNSRYGNISPDGKVDYYLSTIMFKNKFPGNTQIQSLNSSFDGIVKTNFYLDPKNTITGFYSHGFEQYDNYQTPDGLAGNAPGIAPGHVKFETKLSNAVVTPDLQQDHDDQGYDFSYLSFKHNFNTKSFLTDRIYRVYNSVTFHAEPLSNLFQTHEETQTGNQLSYTNQITPIYKLTAGFNYQYSPAYFRNIGNIIGPFSTRPAYGYNDRNSQIHTTTTDEYISNEIKPLGDKLTVTAGLRFGQGKFSHLTLFPSYTDNYADPRFGIVYTPTEKKDIAFRANFTQQSQLPDARRVVLLSPEDLGLTPTATNPAKQQARLAARNRQFNKLGVEHASNFDIGVDKALDIFGDPYSVSLTTYRRSQRGLVQLEYTDFTVLGNPFPTFYDNAGTGHSTGVEFEIAKRARRQTDWNGFISYTNSNSKATSSLFDTGYFPYFSNYVSDVNLTNAQYQKLNKQEFATSYDQRHTVAVVANKRITKLFETSLVLDAGSGFPFGGGVGSSGAIGFGVDSQHSDQTTVNGGGVYGEVPVTLLDQKTIQGVNPVPGRSGWHYKFTLNSTFHLTQDTSLFLNVDNIFDRKTVVNYATTTQAGATYYLTPTAEYPQGRVYYGPSTILTPIFLTFGFRQKF